jgi:hypothetical protein
MIGGKTVTRQNNAVLSTQNNQRSVRYTSPDQCYRFVSNMKPSSAAPGHYMNMNIDIASSLASTQGICGDSSGRSDQFTSSEIHTSVDSSASLFTDAELTSLCSACQLGANCAARRLAGEGQEENQSAEATCDLHKRSHATAKEKCKALEGNGKYFEGCVFDYCTTGEEGFVEGAVAALATKQASPSCAFPPAIADFKTVSGCNVAEPFATLRTGECKETVWQATAPDCWSADGAITIEYETDEDETRDKKDFMQILVDDEVKATLVNDKCFPKSCFQTVAWSASSKELKIASTSHNVVFHLHMKVLGMSFQKAS